MFLNEDAKLSYIILMTRILVKLDSCQLLNGREFTHNKISVII